MLDKANRHGLIAGATGSGKTITLKVLAASPLNVTLKRLASSAKEFGVLVVDGNFNGDIGSNASKAHFVKIADFNAEKAPKAREWQIRVIDLKETNDLLK